MKVTNTPLARKKKPDSLSSSATRDLVLQRDRERSPADHDDTSFGTSLKHVSHLGIDGNVILTVKA